MGLAGQQDMFFKTNCTKRMKRQATNQEKIFAKTHAIKDLHLKFTKSS